MRENNGRKGRVSSVPGMIRDLFHPRLAGIGALCILLLVCCFHGPAQGADATGFWAPPPMMDDRSGGLKKGETVGSEMVLDFRITVPGDAKVRERLDYGPWATYGYIKQAMVWDVNGYVMGGYTKTTRDNARLSGPYKLYIQKWDAELGTWQKYSESSAATGGTASFPEQGYYRITVLPLKAAFRLSPKYGTVMVKDPQYERKGKKIYYDIFTKLPSPYLGTGMTISGAGKTRYQFGGSTEFRPNCGRWTIQAMARQGVVKWETNSSRRMEHDSTPEYYRDAVWALRGEDGTVLKKVEATQSFIFEANHWGDGNYTLETHLAAKHQGKGIQNMTVGPANTSIQVRDCGKGQYKKPEPQTTTFEGGTTEKKTVDVGNLAANKFAALNANNVKQVPVAAPAQFVKQQNPETPDVPVKLSKDCPDLQRQISHRTKQLQISCDSPINLMHLMLKAPKRYNDMEGDFAKEWDAILTKIQASREPFVKPAQEYAQLITTAYKEGLVISAEDQKNYRPMDEYGNPSVMGRGIPVGYFVFDKDKIALADKLRAEQKRLYEVWATARRDLEKTIPQLKAEVEKANQRFNDYYDALLGMRTDLQKTQNTLADMYYSGKYEHCLGYGGQKTSGNYEITNADGKREKGAAWGLPGMNIELPEPGKHLVENVATDIPKPLHEIHPLRIKQDGVKQAEMDRKLIESLVEAERLKYEAERGSWLNWVGNKCLWLLQPTGLDAFMENIAAGKSVTDSLTDAAGTVGERYAWLGGQGSDAVGATVDWLTKKPATEAMEDMDNAARFIMGLIPNILEGTGEDVAKYLRSRESLKEIESSMDEQAGLIGKNTAQDNNKAVDVGLRQLQLWREMEEGGKAMDNLVLLAATSKISLELAKTLSPEVKAALEELAKYMKASLQQAKQVGTAIGEKAVLTAKAKYLDDLKQAGTVAGEKVDDALKSVNEALKAGNTLDDALKAQQQVAKDVEKLLDDAVEAKKLAGVQAKDLPAPKQVALVEENVGREIGHGGSGTVKEYGQAAVVKEFDRGVVLSDGGRAMKINLADYAPGKGNTLTAREFQEMQEQIMAKFKQEFEGSQALREANLSHVAEQGYGTKKVTVVVQEGGRAVRKEIEVPYLVKEKWSGTQASLSSLIGENTATGTVQRSMTYEEQIRVLQSIDEAAKKGVVNLDPNAGNFVVSTEGGVTKVALSESGSVVKIGNADQAREVMKKMIAENTEGDALWQRMAAGSEFEKIGGKELASKLDSAMEVGGATFQNNNVGRFIDKNLLEIWKDPKKWEEFMKNYNRSSVLNNPSAYLTPEGVSSLKKLEEAKTAAEQSVQNAASNSLSLSQRVGQEISGLSTPSAEEIRAAEAAEKAIQEGTSLNILGPVSRLGPEDLSPSMKEVRYAA